MSVRQLGKKYLDSFKSHKLDYVERKGNNVKYVHAMRRGLYSHCIVIALSTYESNSCVCLTFTESFDFITRFSFLFYLSTNQENMDLLSMPSTPERKRKAASELHLEDEDEEARDSDSFKIQQLFSFTWQIARAKVMIVKLFNSTKNVFTIIRALFSSVR